MTSVPVTSLQFYHEQQRQQQLILLGFGSSSNRPALIVQKCRIVGD